MCVELLRGRMKHQQERGHGALQTRSLAIELEHKGRPPIDRMLKHNGLEVHG